MRAAPILYLVASCVGAGLTALSVLPSRRPGRSPVAFFLSGLLAGELAAFSIGWQVLATAVFAVAGAFTAWPGWLGLAISLVSWTAMAASVRGLGRAAPILETALSESLGSRFRDAIGPVWSARCDDEVVRPWSVPYRRKHPEVERIADLSYGPAGERNLLDVYRPKNGATGCPVLMYVHGGAWTMGDKFGQGLPFIHYLTRRGFVCVSPNYRLSPNAAFPDHLIDLKRAMAWIRRHGAEYGADPSWIAVSGGSAGGHLSALLALTANAPEYQPGFEDVDTSVTAAVPFYGCYDLLDRKGFRPDRMQLQFLTEKVLQVSPDENRAAWEKASPISLVHAGAPPFFVIHGGRDSLLFHQDADAFVEALRAVSRQPVAYALIPGAEHAFDVFFTPRTAAAVGAAARFLFWVHSTVRPAGAAMAR